MKNNGTKASACICGAGLCRENLPEKYFVINEIEIFAERGILKRENRNNRREMFSRNGAEK